MRQNLTRESCVLSGSVFFEYSPKEEVCEDECRICRISYTRCLGYVFPAMGQERCQKFGPIRAFAVPVAWLGGIVVAILLLIPLGETVFILMLIGLVVSSVLMAMEE